MKNQKHKNKKQESKPPSAKPAGKDYSFWLISFTLLLVLVAYIPVFTAGFVNWDDDDYVVKNFVIRSFSNLSKIITSPVQGNYHPLTMLSLAINYAMGGLKPFSYHLFNLVFHLLNTLLVYRLVSRLTNNNNIIAFTTALLFGIHPLHVESVAWVSERKDVLYGFFFLLGLIFYLKYIDSGQRKLLLLTFLWYLLSLASKPAAIIFPATLFTLDFFRRRKITAKLIIEKIPFLIFAILLAYLTLQAQKTIGATDKKALFSFGDRLFFGFYGYAMYFLKMILPVNLVAFYPLPAAMAALPSYFLATPLFFIATVVVCLLTWKKNRVVTFGFAFYFVNLLLVLQLVSIGSALIADRYAYIPLIGLFFIIGWYLDKNFGSNPAKAYGIIALAGIVLTPLTYNQAGTWKNSLLLWDHAIEKLPSARAYVSGAMELQEQGNNEKALTYYNEAINFNKSDAVPYGNRGNIYFDRQLDSLAMNDYNSALSLNPDFVPALSNRGALYYRRGNYSEGLINLDRALTLQPDYAPALKNRGTTFLAMKQFENAIADFGKYLQLVPGEIEIYNAIGVCYQSWGKYDLSLKPFNDAIGMDPKPMYFINRSYSYKALGNLDEARKDAVRARDGGANLDPAYAKSIGL